MILREMKEFTDFLQCKIYYINDSFPISNRKKINEWDVKEHELELVISKSQVRQDSRPSISLKHEELDNWDDTHD